ncbi:N-acetylmuramoyl-L-alanine amidase family protein [Polyangium jinanense]|uniref:N-acetylmuramoyl-L-alanine amidase n=1 Tax=Polyangium jinanense TaxID=2829994 RepID=A0A9X4AP83_9BACT|nr:N-acetylmuramoyl-L-alanine amidase [Polyangium jinanense]MDC3953105.1 N-acetylmuramoyl-L-alanine amidase [Polyangium jinanense]MDC3979774.1 N-acetylmuramoyl-L-alanine amidase [Polyangium jinanense]
MTTVSPDQEKALATEQSDGSAVQKCAVIVVIDPGHGDRLKKGNPIDPGCVHGDIYEKDLALAIGKLLKPKLEAKTSCVESVHLTRDGDISELRRRLHWRTNIAKDKKANIFISLHLDAAGASASGQSVCHHPSFKNSVKLATAISARAKVVKPKTKGAISPRSDLHVLNKNHFGKETKASVLIELGFISNDADRTACQTKQSEIAAEIADGVEDFILANKAIFSEDSSLPKNVPIPQPRPANR